MTETQWGQAEAGCGLGSGQGSPFEPPPSCSTYPSSSFDTSSQPPSSCQRSINTHTHSFQFWQPWEGLLPALWGGPSGRCSWNTEGKHLLIHRESSQTTLLHTCLLGTPECRHAEICLARSLASCDLMTNTGPN